MNILSFQEKQSFPLKTKKHAKSDPILPNTSQRLKTIWYASMLLDDEDVFVSLTFRAIRLISDAVLMTRYSRYPGHKEEAMRIKCA